MGQSVAIVLTLALGALGGWLFQWLGMPAAWLAGAMVTVAGASLARLPMRVPGPLRAAAFTMIGVSMGAGVTPETVHLMRTWPLSMILLGVSVAGIAVACSAYLERVHRWDRLTARFSAMPGALSAVLAMAADTGSDVPRVALVHGIRLVALVVVMPWALRLGAPSGSAPFSAAVTVHDAHGLIILLGASGLAALACEKLRVPGGLLLGAMVASAALHGAGIVAGRLPQAILVAGFVVTGSVIGSRFSGVSPAVLRKALGPAVGSIILALALSAGFAWAGASWLHLSFDQLWLAYAPGGVEAMTIVAFTLGLDTAFIGSHHVVRFLGIGLLAPWWAPETKREPQPLCEPQEGDAPQPESIH